MTNDEFEYDPERALWRPGRRSFLFMFGAAVGGLLVPGATEAPSTPTHLGGIGVWNRALTSEEIAELWATPLTYPFERGSAFRRKILAEEGP